MTSLLQKLSEMPEWLIAAIIIVVVVAAAVVLSLARWE
jgi:hypothetical protein